MEMYEVLDWIKQMNASESKIILEASAERRESLLSGGKVIWHEYTKEQAERMKQMFARIEEMGEEDAGIDEMEEKEADIIRRIAFMNHLGVDDILDAAVKRKEALFPGWDIAYIALPQNDWEERKETLEKLLEWEESYHSKCESSVERKQNHPETPSS